MNKNKLLNINLLLNDETYFDWLEKFTINTPIFYNNNWHLFTNQLTKEDINNIKKLALLFESIAYYATKNYIPPKKDTILNNYYKININDTGYKIGLVNTQKNTLACKKTNIFNETNYININDIINYFNNQESEIKPTLNNLHQMILELLDNNISPEDITNTTISALKGPHKVKKKVIKK